MRLRYRSSKRGFAMWMKILKYLLAFAIPVATQVASGQIETNPTVQKLVGTVLTGVGTAVALGSKKPE